MNETKTPQDRKKLELEWRSFAPLAKTPAAARVVFAQISEVAASSSQSYAFVKSKIPPIWLSFILFVIIPAFASTVYFAFIAADQYVVETRFAVRSAEGEIDQPEPAVGGAPTPGAGAFSFTTAGQNPYIVTSYINSRAIVDDLSHTMNLKEIFRRPEADFWARLERDASIDELKRYWTTMVSAYVDATSAIVTVKLRAFRRDDALALGQAIISASETLANRISQRARRDSTAMAERDLAKAFDGVQTALAELRRFRDSNAMIDPGQAMTDVSKLLGPLMSDKIRIQENLFIAEREMSADAPTVRVLKRQLETVEDHIRELKGKLTSVSGKEQSLSGALTKFEELDIKRMLAERLYMLAQSQLDKAQQRAARQAIYLTVVDPPALPEESLYPRRAAFSILVFVALGVVWSIVMMILASIDDHRL